MIYKYKIYVIRLTAKVATIKPSNFVTNGEEERD